MRIDWVRHRCVVVGLLAGVVGGMALVPRAKGADGHSALGSMFTVTNESGAARTINVSGFPVVALRNPFFRDLGANGRRCVTCHQPDNNMSVSAVSIQERFAA